MQRYIRGREEDQNNLNNKQNKKKGWENTALSKFLLQFLYNNIGHGSVNN